MSDCHKCAHFNPFDDACRLGPTENRILHGEEECPDFDPKGEVSDIEKVEQVTKGLDRVVENIEEVSDISGKIVPTADFKAYIQKEGRVSIPKADMDAAGLDSGDLVSVHIRKIQREIKEPSEEVKKLLENEDIEKIEKTANEKIHGYNIKIEEEES